MKNIISKVLIVILILNIVLIIINVGVAHLYINEKIMIKYNMFIFIVFTLQILSIYILIKNQDKKILIVVILSIILTFFIPTTLETKVKYNYMNRSQYYIRL